MPRNTFLKNVSTFKTDGVTSGLILLRQTVVAIGLPYWLFVFLSFAFAAANLLPPELFRYFTKGISEQQMTTAFLRQLALFGLLISLVMFVTVLLGIVCREWMRLHVEAHLRLRVMQSLHTAKLTRFDESDRGEWITRVTRDLSGVESFLTESIPEQLRSVALLFGASGLFIYHFGLIALLPIGAALFLGLLNLFVQIRIAPVLTTLRDLHASVFQMLLESYEGRKTIRSFAAQPIVFSKFEGRVNEVQTKGLGVVKWLGALLGSNQLLANLMTTICLSAGVWFLFSDRLSIGSALIIPFYIGLFFSAAQSLASSAYSWNRFFVEGARLEKFLNQPVEYMPVSTNLAEIHASLEVRDLVAGKGSFRSAPLSFSCGPNDLLLLEGPSGSGKSTILDVLAGLRQPLAGEACVIYRSKTVANIGRKIDASFSALVEQHPYMFSGTYLENLSLGNAMTAVPEEVWRALRQTGLADLVMARGGLHAMVGDMGVNLSVGQRYRLGLARAILSNQPLILIDEPFAAIDPKTTASVVQAINSMKVKSAVIVVSHVQPEDLAVDRVVSTVSSETARSENIGSLSGFTNLPTTIHSVSFPDRDEAVTP